MDEASWCKGNRAAWRSMLAECIKQLGYEQVNDQKWIVERESIIAMLREICEKHGDNSWTNHSHLGDVIENLDDSLEDYRQKTTKAIKSLIQAASTFLDDRMVEGTWGVQAAQDVLADAIKEAVKIIEN